MRECNNPDCRTQFENDNVTTCLECGWSTIDSIDSTTLVDMSGPEGKLIFDSVVEKDIKRGNRYKQQSVDSESS